MVGWIEKEKLVLDVIVKILGIPPGGICMSKI
jgi:hypothetical protein